MKRWTVSGQSKALTDQRDGIRNLKVLRERKFPLFLIGLGGAVFLLRLLAGHSPMLTTKLYFSHLYPLGRAFLGAAVGVLPFPVAPILLFGLMIFLGGCLVCAVWNLLKRRRGEFLFFSFWLIAAGSLLYTAFYLFWGFNYFKQPLSQQLSLQKRNIAFPILLRESQQVVRDLNRTVPAALAISLHEERQQLLRKLLPKVNRALAGALRQENLPVRGQVPVRFYPLGRLAMQLGGPGLYFPLTGEVYLPSLRLPVEFPFLIAHELAHARGFAREDEANFWGFVATQSADDPFVQHSGALSLFAYLENAVCTQDEKVCEVLEEGLRPEVQRERQAIWENERRYLKPQLTRASRKVYDAYLRSNQIPEGVANYDRALSLYLRWRVQRQAR